jgi:predicted AAA+ superfamily ATPase
MLMVRILQPWHANIGKRQVKSPKSYIRDSGIFHYLTHINDRDALALSPKRGASFEGFVLEEIIRTTRTKPEDCFFWRTHAGAELDLLLLIGDKKIGFEIKMTDKPSVTKSMHVALTDCGLDHLYLVHPGDISWSLGDKMTALCLPDISEINNKLKVLQIG